MGAGHGVGLPHGLLRPPARRPGAGRHRVPLADQFRTLVAEPLGADFHLGVPGDALDRCADLIAPTGRRHRLLALPEGNLLIPTMVNPLLDVEAGCNSAEFRTVSVAGINGHGNARSIARRSRWSRTAARSAAYGCCPRRPSTGSSRCRPTAPTWCCMVPLRWGIGYGLPQPASAPAVPEGRVCWWTGYGGSIVVNDLDRRITVAYAMNRMADHFISSHAPTPTCARPSSAWSAGGAR